MDTKRQKNERAHFSKLLSSAFVGLGIRAPVKKINGIALVLLDAMGRATRQFHNCEHSISLCRDLAPRQVLAALFHDLVYLKVDQGIPPLAAEMISQDIVIINQQIFLTDRVVSEPYLGICASIFGISSKSEISSMEGGNEFLSALVAIRCLHPYLSLNDLIAVISAIEATIPFRPVRIAETQAKRIRLIAKQYLHLTDANLNSYVKAVIDEGVALANKDVSSFADSNFSEFLAQTQLLIEESNPNLYNGGYIDVKKYRTALVAILHFLENLSVERIFHAYKNVPDQRILKQFRKGATGNIVLTISYFKAKLTTLALLESIENLPDGNSRLMCIFKNISELVVITQNLPITASKNDAESEVMAFLATESYDRARKDSDLSALTLHVYRKLECNERRKLEEMAKAMLSGKITSQQFLSQANPIIKIE